MAVIDSLHVVFDCMLYRGSQYPSIAEEIKGVASADPVHRKLFVRGLAWNTSSETLRAVSALPVVFRMSCLSHNRIWY